MTADRIKLPDEVAAIYEAVDKLEAEYPGPPVHPDGHLVGSIGSIRRAIPVTTASTRPSAMFRSS